MKTVAVRQIDRAPAADAQLGEAGASSVHEAGAHRTGETYMRPVSRHPDWWYSGDHHTALW